MSVSKMIRPLGSIEKFVDCCTMSRNLNMAVGVTVKTKTKITLDLLERALTNLQADNLQLQACLKRQSEIPEKGWSINPFSWFKAPKPVPRPEFWSLPNEMMKIPIQFITSKNCDWMTVLEDVLQVNFEEGKLLWRAYWVENAIEKDSKGTLVLNIHPTLTDAKGLFLFANDALGYIDQILSGQPKRSVTPKMHTNVEETVDIGNGMSFMEKLEMGKHMILCMIPWKSPYMATNPAPIVPEYATRHLKIEVPLEVSKQILKCVETKGVSLHAAWTAAAGIAIHRRIHGAYCNYVEDKIDTDDVKSQEEFWNFATTVHKSLIEKFNSEKLVKMMQYCGQFGDMYSMFATLGSIRNVRNDYAVAVHDNLDYFIDDRDSMEIENLCATVASHNMGRPFHHSVHVFREKFYYYMYRYGNYTNIDQTKEFADKTLEVLKMNCA